MPVIDFNATMCKHCYKCVRNCDVKAIMVRDGRAIIMPNRCVVCGQCVRCCPQSAKVSSSELELVKSFMADGHRVIVSLSSSFMSLFPSVRPGQMKGALLEAGLFRREGCLRGRGTGDGGVHKAFKRGKDGEHHHLPLPQHQ